MEKEFNLERYMTNGVETIVRGALRATLSNPKESIFMAKYAIASKGSSELRSNAEESGEHIPPFLIASITSKCNLHCAGCYSRANNACSDDAAMGQLSTEEWVTIFHDAHKLGVGFILLAGGEPLIREDVITAAGKIEDVLFPIFTNGTMIDEHYIKIFDRYRNLVPILSIEGPKHATDMRRGEGIYQKLIKSMSLLKDHGILFGASVTVTTKNIQEVTEGEFLDFLYENGCKSVIYVEFVPVTDQVKDLAPGENEREYLRNQLVNIRDQYKDMVFIAFPGDEKSSGGCLAAGRGFFHINSKGGAEPCPFSPYSDINVKETSLREALKSKLFTQLRDQNILMEEHAGGCVLFERREQVEKLLSD